MIEFLFGCLFSWKWKCLDGHCGLIFCKEHITSSNYCNPNSLSCKLLENKGQYLCKLVLNKNFLIIICVYFLM